MGRFMENEIVFGHWWQGEAADGGTYFAPADIMTKEQFARDVLGLDPENEETVVDEREGWGCRLWAPGYLDSTDWCVFDSENEADAYLEEMYGDDEEEF